MSHATVRRHRVRTPGVVHKHGLLAGDPPNGQSVDVPGLPKWVWQGNRLQGEARRNAQGLMNRGTPNTCIKHTRKGKIWGKGMTVGDGMLGLPTLVHCRHCTSRPPQPCSTHSSSSCGYVQHDFRKRGHDSVVPGQVPHQVVLRQVTGLGARLGGQQSVWAIIA